MLISVRKIACKRAMSMEAATPLPETSPKMKNKSPDSIVTKSQ